MLCFGALMGSIFMLTQYLQSVLGFTPLKAGAVLVPMSLVLVVLAPLSARLVERVGTKAVVGGGLLVVSLALGIQSRLAADTPTWVVVAMTIVLACGMANVMAPATESIMGSLPREKAGVGSAVNDTTRQVGGAIGVALLGSLMASRYGGRVDGDLAGGGLPAATVDRIGGNVQAGVAAAGDAGGSLGARILDVSHGAFLSGMHLAVLVAAGITLVAAAGVFLWLPSRAVVPADAVAPRGPDEDADVVAVRPAGSMPGA
jgi:Na+/melibiose symporter-like transporter